MLILKGTNLLCAALACSLGACGRQTVYIPPDLPEGEKAANRSYIEAPHYRERELKNLDPKLDSPEAAVVKFLASRCRGDEAYLEALPPRTGWPEGLTKKVEEWKTWKALELRLLSIQYDTPDYAHVRVYMKLEIDGKSKDGEDSFTLVKRGDNWFVLNPPT